jgi:hypothetical protein
MDQDGVVGANILKGMQLKATITGSATGVANGIALISEVGSTAANVDQAVGGAFTVGIKSATAGSTTINSTASGVFSTLLNQGNHSYTVTNGYGFDLLVADNTFGSGSGTLHFNDFKNININNAGNDYSKLSVDNLTGIWLDKQTLGGTSNYGLVLNGDGAIGDYGAAIVLGASQNARIYGKTDGVYVYDGIAESKISPHDPETGEWIYYSKNIKTGKIVRVDMARLVKAVEKLTGETFMVETLIQE